MLKNSTATFLEKVKLALGTDRDADLAARLGVGKSTIASWRLREEIPKKKLKVIEELSGIRFDSVRTDTIEGNSVVLSVTRIAYLHAVGVAFNSSSPHSINAIVSYLIANEQELLEKIVSRVQSEAKHQLTEDDLISLVQRAYDGKFMSAGELTGVIRVEQGSSIGSSSDGPPDERFLNPNGK
ncbi:helix-turn-helix domain-containing protein [Methylosinus sp. KRF6]|uniref:helix-turn-helix domain-containing protein n=1 Tax=Methylosinus sp. KRF6 TaxID=2846853 RepID=UPI001C0ADD60|nr:helix-turn-helix domain-containing protein [Methylosinus sp. KRF6]MBU3889860.1 helix-turn-helix domain containing protein [Methylosinus sp. KRF6]